MTATNLYVYYENNVYQGKGTSPDEQMISINVSQEMYDTFNPYMWILEEDELVPNPNYEQEEAVRERQRLDALTLTPADVERALYKAENMDFEDLKAFIVQQLPQVDIKALAIEFRAKDFYRGATAGGVRLFDTIGQLLGYKVPEDMDYLFEHKELPSK